MMYYYNDFAPFHMYGFGLFGFVISILFWAVIIMLIVSLLRRNRHNYWHGHGEDRSMEILKERYAKGEITKEQFESMKKDLQ